MTGSQTQPFEHFESFEKICEAMANPAFYPHRVVELKRIDTHISTVFMTGYWAYKLKKPVDFGFLDFRDLDARGRFCRREVELNSRLSRGVYQGVVEIREDDSGRVLGLSPDGRRDTTGKGKVVEYAVKMRQLPDEASLESLLKAGKAARSRAVDLGRRVAEFYEHSRTNPEIARFGAVEAISYNVEENFRQLEPFIDGLSARERRDLMRQVSRSFLKICEETIEGRVRDGRIRDCHGDLRADHVYFYRGIQIIDCIEFNDRFRYSDVVNDLAFLHMDLEHRGYDDWSDAFLAAYVERAGDHGLYALLDFYASYRAVVRFKVACLRSTEVSGPEGEAVKREALGYLDQAYRYAVQFSRPALWVFCGLPAAGKSMLGEATAGALGIPVFESDRVRKEMEAEHGRPKSGVAPFGTGQYKTEIRQLVYGEMLARAQERVKSGRPVVLDATFSRRKWRDDVRRLAADLDCSLLFVECACREETLRSRLEARTAASGLSDARLEHLPQMLASFEPTSELPSGIHIKVDTDLPFSRNLVEVLSEGYAKKRAQVRALLRTLE